MINPILVINFDLSAVFLTLSGFMVPGIMISGVLFKKYFNKASVKLALVYYLVSGFMLGTLLFVLLMMILVGGAKYIK